MGQPPRSRPPIVNLESQIQNPSCLSPYVSLYPPSYLSVYDSTYPHLCLAPRLRLCLLLNLNPYLDLDLNLNSALFLNSFRDSFPASSHCTSLASSPAK